MSDDSTTQCLLFPGIFRKPIVAQFDQGEGSSDGGALLLKAADRHYGLVAGLSSCLRDDRQAGKVDHRCASWWRSECLRSPAATRTPTIQPACPRIRFTNYFWIAIRWRCSHKARSAHRSRRLQPCSCSAAQTPAKGQRSDPDRTQPPEKADARCVVRMPVDILPPLRRMKVQNDVKTMSFAVA